MKQVTISDIKKSEEIRAYIQRADDALKGLGITEHSFAHVNRCSENACKILKGLGYSEREQELAQIAGYMHDIGNIVNRVEHAQSGAVMAFRILDRMGMKPDEIAQIISAIGNHDEGTAVPTNPITAALILADKSDVRRSRVRNDNIATFDIHDRVNYAVEKSELKLDTENKTIILSLKIDTNICALMDYFEIFLGRMMLCRKAAEFLNINFGLIINKTKLL